MENKTEAKENARIRWMKAKAELAHHEPVSDVQLHVSLLERGVSLKKGVRGLALLIVAGLMPMVPGFFAGSDATPFEVKLFVYLGLIALVAGMYWLYKDCIDWYRWWRSKKSLSDQFYDYPFLALYTNHRKEDDLRVLDRESPEWRSLENAVEREEMKPLKTIWQKWNENPKPVRYMDFKLLREGIFAYNHWLSHQRKK